MIKQEIQCTGCGTSNELGSVFCMECGVTLKVETANFVSTKKTKSRRACIVCGTTGCDHQQTNDKYDYCCLDLPLKYSTKPCDCKGCGIIDGNLKKGHGLSIPIDEIDDETDITIVGTLKKGTKNLETHNHDLVYKPPKNHQGLREDLESEAKRHSGNEDDYIEVYNYQSPVPKRIPIPTKPIHTIDDLQDHYYPSPPFPPRKTFEDTPKEMQYKPNTDRVPAPLKPLKKGSELTLTGLKNDFANGGIYFAEMEKHTTFFAESIKKNMKYKLWGTFLSMSIALTIIIEVFL